MSAVTKNENPLSLHERKLEKLYAHLRCISHAVEYLLRKRQFVSVNKLHSQALKALDSIHDQIREEILSHAK